MIIFIFSRCSRRLTSTMEETQWKSLLPVLTLIPASHRPGRAGSNLSIPSQARWKSPHAAAASISSAGVTATAFTCAFPASMWGPGLRSLMILCGTGNIWNALFQPFPVLTSSVSPGRLPLSGAALHNHLSGRREIFPSAVFIGIIALSQKHMCSASQISLRYPAAEPLRVRGFLIRDCGRAAKPPNLISG